MTKHISKAPTARWWLALGLVGTLLASGPVSAQSQCTKKDPVRDWLSAAYTWVTGKPAGTQQAPATTLDLCAACFFQMKPAACEHEVGTSDDCPETACPETVCPYRGCAAGTTGCPQTVCPYQGCTRMSCPYVGTTSTRCPYRCEAEVEVRCPAACQTCEDACCSDDCCQAMFKVFEAWVRGAQPYCCEDDCKKTCDDCCKSAKGQCTKSCVPQCCVPCCKCCPVSGCCKEGTGPRKVVGYTVIYKNGSMVATPVRQTTPELREMRELLREQSRQIRELHRKVEKLLRANQQSQQLRQISVPNPVIHYPIPHRVPQPRHMVPHIHWGPAMPHHHGPMAPHTHDPVSHRPSTSAVPTRTPPHVYYIPGGFRHYQLRDHNDDDNSVRVFVIEVDENGVRQREQETGNGRTRYRLVPNRPSIDGIRYGGFTW